jgi:hypothetical protein
LPQSDDAGGREALEAVAREITELGRLSVELDAALQARDWPRLDGAIADSRRVRHAMGEAMTAAAPYRDEPFDAAVFTRLQEIYAYRDDRLKALELVHSELGGRLRQLSRWKGYARSVGSKETRRGLSAIDSLR